MKGRARPNFATPGVSASNSTVILEIETNATKFTTGNIAFIDGFSANAAGFAPAAAAVEPESKFKLKEED
jgi:hypothetical protein